MSYFWIETGLNKQESFSFGAMPRPNIPDREKAWQDLVLSHSQVAAFELSLYDTIIHAALTLLELSKEKKTNYNNNDNN